MIPIINLLAASLVWLAVFLLTKFNIGVSSNSILATTIVAVGVIVVFFGLNTFRLAIKPNPVILAFVLLFNLVTLFAMDYFVADFTIISPALGVGVGLVIAAIFFGALLARKAVLGDRTQL